MFIGDSLGVLYHLYVTDSLLGVSTWLYLNYLSLKRNELHSQHSQLQVHQPKKSSNTVYNKVRNVAFLDNRLICLRVGPTHLLQSWVHPAWMKPLRVRCGRVGRAASGWRAPRKSIQLPLACTVGYRPHVQCSPAQEQSAWTRTITLYRSQSGRFVS